MMGPRLLATRPKRPRGRPKKIRIGGDDLSTPGGITAGAMRCGIPEDMLATDVLRQQGGTLGDLFVADVHTELSTARAALSAALGDTSPRPALLEEVAIAIAGWLATGKAFRQRGPKGGQPPRADGVLVADLAKVLRSFGFKGSIGGDSDGALRSDSVRLADEIVRRRGQRHAVSPDSIKRAREIRGA